jgi:hypothetical protein
VTSLLNLKIINYLFYDFDQQNTYEKEEAEYAYRALKDSSSNNIDGVPRKEIEKLVYAKRALIMQKYS